MPDTKTEKPKTEKLLEVTLYMEFTPEDEIEMADYMDAFWDAFHELERKWNNRSLNLEKLPGKIISHEYEVKEVTEE